MNTKMHHNRFFIRQIWCRILQLSVTAVALLTTIVSTQAQRQFGSLVVESLNDPYPGYYLFAPNSADSLGLMDHSGRVVIRYEVGPHANPRSDVPGLISHFAILRNAAGLVYGYVVRNGNNEVLDTIYPVGQMTADFHEGRIWSDTSFLVLSQRWVPVDLSKYRAGGNRDALVVEGIIQEISKDGKVLFEWRSLDHIDPSATMEDMDFGLDVVDYIHINSVERDTDGNLLVSCRHIDAVLKIDRITGKLLWAMGGTASRINDFTFIDDSTSGFRGFSHQHSAFRTSSGTLMLFDNGNLKPPPQATRIVEYEVNEVAKTVRRVWEYYPEPSIFTTTMGSVSELPNGHILIGYGSRITDETSPGRVLEEIDRNGNVYSRMRFDGAPRITPYRVSKVQFGMTAWRRIVDKPQVLSAMQADSTTNLDINVTAVARPTAIVVEKHHYAPHVPTFTGLTPCVVAPYRWIVRCENGQQVTGTMKFHAKGLAFADPSDPWQLVWRSTEASGAFTRVDGAAFDARDSAWNVPRVTSGEYALVSADCILSRTISPVRDTVITVRRPKLVFSSAAGAGSYEVQVSRTNAFTRLVHSAVVTDTFSVCVSDLREGVTHYWRVRRIRNGVVGLWSNAATFSVRPNVPVLVFPVSETDTAGAAIGDALRWQAFSGARTYRVLITGANSGETFVDQVVSDTVLEIPPTLKPSRPYVWSVTASTDTGATSAATSFFGTLPDRPWIISPEPSVHLDRSREVDVRFRPVSETDSAEVFVSLARGGAIGTWPVEGRQLGISGLPPEQDLLVGVRVLGRYGWRESKLRRIRLVQAASLTKPEFIQPLDGDFVPIGAVATFEWMPVDDATSYHVQATDWVAFDRLTLDTVVTETIVLKRLAQGAPFLQWRVQPRSDRGIGPWSDTAFVTLRGGEQPNLVPRTPRFGKRGVPTTGSLVVGNVLPSAKLTAEVGTDPYFDEGMNVVDFRDSTGLYNGLSPNLRYYWRPVAMGPDTLRTYGATSVFTTDGTSSTPEPANESAVTIRFDRRSRAIFIPEPNPFPATLKLYSLDGRLLFLRRVDVGEQMIDVSGVSQWPTLLIVELQNDVGHHTTRQILSSW
ncbi:MAG: hypothetical protein FGM33_05340 [Candidatus Kapabacteria bacterium]|nr:hypothetical protein [Candidatus Kapabacteria bacterium]